MRWSKEALDLLRQRGLRERDLGEGRAILDEAYLKLKVLEQCDRSIFYILGRFYFGSLAYYHYREGDSGLASEMLDKAEQSVIKAIEENELLMPCAPLLVDIPLQRARLARHAKQWNVMQHHLERLVDIQEGSLPLCVLSDGRRVDYEMLTEFFAGIDSDETSQQMVESLVDAGKRRKMAYRFVSSLYIPSGFSVLLS